MTVEYSDAPEVGDIAVDLIETTHPHLDGVEIRYIWRSEAAKSKGRVLLGRARKVSGLNAFLAGGETEFFVIEMAGDLWKGLTTAQRYALVDHELSHCAVDEETETLAMRAHDCEEFIGVIERHGLWKGDVAALIEAGRGVQRLPGVESATVHLVADEEGR